MIQMALHKNSQTEQKRSERSSSLWCYHMWRSGKYLPRAFVKQGVLAGAKSAGAVPDRIGVN